MKQSQIFRFIIILEIFVLTFSSCKWGHKRVAPKGKNIICIVDFSDSRNATERLIFYMNVIKTNIIPKLGLQDKITVLPIDQASITNSSDILLKDLSSMNFEPEQANPMEEEQITNNNLKKYKDSLASEFIIRFQSAIDSRNKSNHGTDLFGALGIAKGKLKQGDDNYLIILSDMMNWSGDIKYGDR